MGKTWKKGGTEDKFIKTLIKKGAVNRFTKPLKLKRDNPEIFADFTPNVVRNHLNELKRSHGLYVDGDSEDDTINNDNEIIGKEPDERATITVPDQFVGDGPNESISGKFVVHRNYPALCETYKDPDIESDKVALILTLPAGAQGVTIEITDDGMIATVKYKWVRTMYVMSELFGKMIAAKQINIHHPRVLCIKNGLEKYRKRIDTAPEASIKISLPIRVQNSANSWSYSAVSKADGTQILLADFTGYVREYNAKIGEVEFN